MTDRRVMTWMGRDGRVRGARRELRCLETVSKHTQKNELGRQDTLSPQPYRTTREQIRNRETERQKDRETENARETCMSSAAMFLHKANHLDEQREHKVIKLRPHQHGIQGSRQSQENHASLSLGLGIVGKTGTIPYEKF